MVADDWFSKKMDLTRKVRAVLVEYHVDLEKIAVNVHPRHVWLRGVLTRRVGEGNPLSGEIIQKILSDIMRIQGVYRVDFDLQNWQLSPSGEIREKTEATTRGHQPPRPDSP